MLLSNLYSLPGWEKVNILIEEEKISSVSKHTDSLPGVSNSVDIKFEDAIVFPGLINSHDHLDYNSFPQLGNKVYNDYVEWGVDIHKQNKDVINKVLKIPRELRIQWGIYKNLLNGITTVVNHGPKLQVNNDLITVWQECHTLHSVQLEKKWKIKLNLPFIKKQVFAVHAGEGTDAWAEKEIDELIKWNLFKRELIGIHAIAMNKKQAEKFKAIVWCPDSNYFLIGKTAAINELKNKTKILFGTDSALSAKWNLWEHLRLARQEKMIGDNELFDALTANAANIWGMSGCGSIVKNNSADVVIARRKKGLNGMDSFFALNTEDILMVMHKGQIVLFDDEILSQLSNVGILLDDFHKIAINGIGKYVLGNLPELIKAIREYYPEVTFPVTC
jgi:cytosine/adenosine deaminase-related metal-dependent hydrolase